MPMLLKSGLQGLLKQSVRFRSQRWSLGKPPGQARSLEQRLHELKASQIIVGAESKVDIGFARPQPKRKQQVSERVLRLKQNRASAELRPSNSTMLVDLDEVRRDWNGLHVQASAEHYDVYKHLFGDAFFTPAIQLNVTYPEGYPVYCGNLLTPTQTNSKPEVNFESNSDSLWTLALTTPDGHLSNPEGEYVLWLVGNIKGGNTAQGQEIVPYLQPFPLKGIGACRYIFVLYKQEAPLDFSSYTISNTSKEPNSRDFSTYEFYRKFEDEVTPAGLAFFQAEWDQSVQTVFHKVFDSPEPICCYDFPLPYRPKQTWFPLKKAFNLYLDRYRDEKQIAKEFLLKKLKNYDPWTGFKPALQFPNAVPFKANTPSWLKNEMKKQRLGKGRIQDY